MDKSIFNILIGGEAGQGLVTIGQLLSKCLVRSGYSIVVTQGYESRIRGGHNTFSIRLGVDEVLAPQEAVDFLIALDQETIGIHGTDLSPGAKILVDAAWKISDERAISIPYDSMADRRSENIAALGVAAASLGIGEDRLTALLIETFGKRHPDASQKNVEAIHRAYSWCADNSVDLGIKRPKGNGDDRLMMNGNEAIALGALSGGLKFYSYYPMTPSTSIGMTIIQHAKSMGIAYEQAEDEISAINMAIGASFTGAPAMVATSGGGFALMVEGVSLAAMTETPIVIAVAQRPGPATGLPTRTEQADLEFVMHAGHGEFPRAIFTPGDIHECFHLTRKAFEVAWRYQGPVFILTDQFLADSYRAVRPFDGWEGNANMFSNSEGKGERYLRYRITDDGISPRLFPGMTEDLVVADSDEHTEDGHLTEDLKIRKLMVEKRQRKRIGMEGEILPPQLIGDERPDVLFISWGSTKGAAIEASLKLAESGTKASVLHFQQIWPFSPGAFMPFVEGAGRVCVVEGNATAQLARLIRRETGLHIEDHVLRYDGLPITPEYILKHMRG